MSQHQLASMIEMVNQIAANITSGESQEQVAEKVSVHLKRFWSRGMKAQIFAYLEADGSELSPAAKASLERLKTL